MTSTMMTSVYFRCYLHL